MQTMEEIYQAHAQTVYRYLLSLTRDEMLAEELTQETFYQAIRTVNHFDGSCKISTWLCAIAKNCLQTYRRKHPPQDDADAADTRQSPSAEACYFADAGQTEILRVMQRIQPPTRDVLYLRLLGGLSFREIGDILSKTENWARVTFYRGKETLKKELNRNES